MKKGLALVATLFLLLNVCSCAALLDPGDLLGDNPFGQVEEEVATTAPTTEATTAPTTEAEEEAQKTVVELNVYSLEMVVGDSYQLEVYTNSTQTPQWRSSNEYVALVNSQGLITAVDGGATNISCVVDGVEASCTVMVNYPEIETTVTTTAPVLDYSGSQIFPHSSYAYLTEEEIIITLNAYTGDSPTGNYAQDAINEIYARNGYIFQNATIRAFYESTSWYVPDSDFDMDDLNDYEKENIKHLQNFK